MAISDNIRAAIESPAPPTPGLTEDTENVSLQQYSYEQDTNRLARESVEGTVHSIRDSTRRVGIPIAGSIDTWDEPYSSASPRYGFNQVYKPDPGSPYFVQEFDNTPSAERYHLHHPSGSYFEIDSNGSEVRKIVGDNFIIVENNGRIFIAGDASVTIGGTCSVNILGDASLEVGGKLDAVVKSDINLTSSGSFNLNVRDVFKVKAEEFILETTRYNHTNAGEVKVKTKEYTSISENVNSSVSGNTNISTSNFHVTASGSSFLSAVDSNISASGSIKHRAGGPASITGSDIRLKGSVFNLDVGLIRQNPVSSTTGPTGTESPAAATPASTSEPTLTGFTVPATRSVSIQAVRPDLPQRSNRIVRTAIENDGFESAATEELYPGYKNALPYIQQVPSTPIQREPVLATPTSGEFLNMSSFTGEEQLSRYVKLKDLSTSAFFPHKVRAQAGLTEGQIVTNLQALALNVIDKICDKYGRSSFIISSCFRPASGARGGQGLSKHSFGQAVDIQFPSLPTSEYVARAQELVQLIDFDQLILEYQSTGTGRPWFHIQYVEAGNRRQYFTMLNHQRNSPISTV